jgi:cellobiose phosphorylase
MTQVQLLSSAEEAHRLVLRSRGLPLMGSGDWNDGMNLVGAGGKGESVWLGFFLCAVLTQFGALAAQRPVRARRRVAPAGRAGTASAAS